MSNVILYIKDLYCSGIYKNKMVTCIKKPKQSYFRTDLKLMQNMYVYSYLFIKRVDVRNKTESFIFIVRLKKPLFLAIVKYIVSSNMNNI